MEKALNIIISVVVISVFGYLGYTIYTGELRTKELDKKRSDKLDDEKEINKIIKEKLEKGDINIVVEAIVNDSIVKKTSLPSANGNKKKKKVDVAKHTEGK